MFLIDGVPAMNGLAGMYALTALPMSMIDKIEKIPARMINPIKIYCMVGPIFSTSDAG